MRLAVACFPLPVASFQLPHSPLYKFGTSSSAPVTLNDKTNYEIFKMLNFCWVFPSSLAGIQLEAETQLFREEISGEESYGPRFVGFSLGIKYLCLCQFGFPLRCN